MVTSLVVVTFPLALLALMLLMERVERPLRDASTGEQLVDFLETARPDEVETFVSEGFAPALDRYWRRRRLARRLPSRPARAPQQVSGREAQGVQPEGAAEPESEREGARG